MRFFQDRVIQDWKVMSSPTNNLQGPRIFPNSCRVIFVLMATSCPERRMDYLFWFFLLKHKETSLGDPNRAPNFSLARFEACRTLKSNTGKENGMAMIGMAWLIWAEERVTCFTRWVSLRSWVLWWRSKRGSGAPLARCRHGPYPAALASKCWLSSCVLSSPCVFFFSPTLSGEAAVVFADPVHIGSLSWGLSLGASPTFYLHTGHRFYSW